MWKMMQIYLLKRSISYRIKGGFPTFKERQGGNRVWKDRERDWMEKDRD